MLWRVHSRVAPRCGQSEGREHPPVDLLILRGSLVLCKFNMPVLLHSAYIDIIDAHYFENAHLAYQTQHSQTHHVLLHIQETALDIITADQHCPKSTCMYSAAGHAIYRRGSTCVLGARSPVNFQSVMESPERVSRVMPPSTTMLNTQPAQPPSHSVSAWRAPGLSPLPSASTACKQKQLGLTELPDIFS